MRAAPLSNANAPTRNAETELDAFSDGLELASTWVKGQFVTVTDIASVFKAISDPGIDLRAKSGLVNDINPTTASYVVCVECSGEKGA
jgi:hypothetical protein